MTKYNDEISEKMNIESNKVSDNGQLLIEKSEEIINIKKDFKAKSP